MKAVFTDYQYENIEQEKRICREAGIEVAEYQEKCPERLIPLVKDADAVITQYSDINADVIAAMEHCRMIIKYGIGVNNIDVKAAAEKGILVCNVPDYGVEEVSDHAIALMLASNKKLPVITKALKEGDWGYTSIEPVHRFADATVGLVGFGRIPQLVASKLSGFNVRVLVYDPYVEEETVNGYHAEAVDFKSLCRQSDYISVHCPLTEETRHLFNREIFELMKAGAYLINTARGPVVCEADLKAALREGKIAGAALDVFEEEPATPDNELLQIDQVIATPHCAWYSVEATQVLQRKVAEEVVNVLLGNEPFHCVNC